MCSSAFSYIDLLPIGLVFAIVGACINHMRNSLQMRDAKRYRIARERYRSETLSNPEALDYFCDEIIAEES